MKKSLPLLLTISICVLNACSDDSGKESAESCTPETFTASCPTENSYTACIDNQVVTNDCLESEICQDGQCKPNTPTPQPQEECQPDSYTPSCSDTTHRTICNADKKIEQIACQEGTKCQNGECIADKQPCTPDDYQPECADDTHRTICNADKVIEQIACQQGTKCQNGECVVDDSCTPDDFKSECTDSTHRTICTDSRTIGSEECPENTICLNGECTDNTECKQGEYTSECQGTSQYTICTEEGKIESKNCTDNTVCIEGECRNVTLCEITEFISECQDDTHYSACNSKGYVENLECEDNTLCIGGECKDVTPCTPAEFAAECTDDTHYNTCNSKGYVENLACTENMKCLKGTCHPTDCDEVGCLCDEKSFQNSCTDNKQLSCVDGIVTEYDCGTDGLGCYMGKCRLIGTVTCDSKTFVSKCIGDTAINCEPNIRLPYYTGEYIQYYPDSLEASNCAGEDEVCAIIDGKADCYTPCTDANMTSMCMSVSSTATGKCIESSDHKLVFTNKKYQSCLTNTTNFCKDGKCIHNDKVDAECSPKTDKSYCENNVLFECYGNSEKGRFVANECYSGVCTTINGITDCYDSCAVEGKTYYDCDYPGYDKAVKYVCTSTPAGLVYVESEVDCHYCKDTTGMMDDGWEGDICVNQKATTDKSFCKDNVAVNIIELPVESEDDTEYEAYEVPMDCGSQKCVVNEDGEAICADTCKPEDNKKTKYTCEIRNYEPGNTNTIPAFPEEPDSVLPPGGRSMLREKIYEYDDYMSYVSDSYVCTQIGDQYYWVHETRETCDHGCDTDLKCKKLHKDEGNECDDEIRCEGNIWLTCDYDTLTAYNCGAKTCAVLKDGSGCFDTCTAADQSKPFQACVDKTSSTQVACVAAGDGKYVQTYQTNDYCYHGCDSKTGKCTMLHEDEGKKCNMETDKPRCANDLYLECYYTLTSSPDKDESEWRTISCSSEVSHYGDFNEGICIEQYPGEDYSSPKCVPKCTAADVDKPQSVCIDLGPDMQRQEGWVCQKSGDIYYWDSVDKFCEHGCNKEKTACMKLHPEEGTACTTPEETKCGDDKILLICNYYDHSYIAEDCSSLGMTCGKDEDGIATCVNTCTKAEYDSNATKTVCSFDAKVTYQCAQVSKDRYEWRYMDDFKCYHGCNTETNECLPIHDKEYKDCSITNDGGEKEAGPSLCDGKTYLACHEYWNYDDDSPKFIYDAENCNTQSCDANIGCYKPCSEVGQKSVCRGQYEIEITTCIEDEETHIKYIDNTHTSYCPHGCDTSKNECTKIHEDEGKSCSAYEDEPDYYPAKCDKKVFLECDYHNVEATDCDSQACHPKIGCYDSCDMIGKFNVCSKELDISYSKECIEDAELNIKYTVEDDYEYCEKGCDTKTGKCKD
ncbi:MAG: hypothetical protein IJM59_05215 [Proteobacteria bacterium]|nr:hypothetical protein [Pseudomonadota bacterium]